MGYEISPYWTAAFWLVLVLGGLITVYGALVLWTDYLHAADPPRVEDIRTRLRQLPKDGRDV